MNKRCLLLATHQRGTILIVALFIMALLEIVVVGLLRFHRSAIHYSENYFDSIQAINLAMAGEQWAKQRLIKSFKNNENMTQDTLPLKPIKGGTLEAQLYDAQGVFNLNNLLETQYFSGFNNMLNHIGGSQAQTALEKIMKFINSRLTIFEPYFDRQNQNGILPFSSVTELRAITGMSAALYNELSQNIGVLPEVTTLNINSATQYSLLSLDPSITLESARSVIQARNNSPRGFESVGSFLALGLLHSDQITAKNLTIQSQYFLSSSHVIYHDIDLVLVSLLKIMVNNQDSTAANHFNVIVVWRSFGTL